MAELPKQYDPKQHEEKIYKKWEDAGIFAPSEKASGKPFVIMLPPPNITGSLHMGHALQDTIMDILIRWHRMMGDKTVWVPGTDHAAIATNKVIENQLYTEGKTRWDIGREAFMERTEQWYAKTGAEILNQMKRLGCSCDWGRARFTQDDGYVEAVNEAFVRYYEQGYIYRGARIVNWDPKTQTTVSDLEIDWKTEKAPLYTFTYGPFEISTARPETKFGDKYVVMHPDDKRYAKYKDGEMFEAEWINGSVTATVIKDEVIDMKFGTGVMTITPWHDTTDFEIARRHNLDMEQIIGFDGKLLPVAGEFTGLETSEARPKIVEKLQAKGLLVSINENYEHNVALNDRGKGVIEPQVMRQWFVDMKKLKGDTIEVAKKDLIRFVPPRWKKHFIDWMENVYDWNINRQIWLGHRLPVWWKAGTHGTDSEEGNFVVSIEKPAGDYEQDPDVLDTWFSSALWPFATLGWPEPTDDLKTYYPTSVLVTGRDILYLWVARMIFSGLELLKDKKYSRPAIEARIPFHDVFIHPTVLTKKGQRMSKSLGTGIDPLELIEKYGADATRFGLMYQMSYDSQAIKFDEEGIKAARNFSNKLWNIARLLESLPDRATESVADAWIQNRLQAVASEVTNLLSLYKFGEAARILHEFVWGDYADWYLEIIKVEGSTVIAREVFKTTLRLLHPFMPHITEVLWAQAGEPKLLAISAWTAEGVVVDDTSKDIAIFQEVVGAIRSARILLGIKPGSKITIFTENALPLSQALEALAKITISSEKKEGMRALPLQSGTQLFFGSDEITPDSLAAARARLKKTEEKAENLITSTKRIIAAMRGRAAEDKISEKEALVATTEQQLEDIRRSYDLLDE
ncbi:MAG: valine--tRNA ligase [Candidatus Andersenbacteria bacterium]|nr:valine--tRNA ligase [Candidatus Andersenbacteria bacterium]MBI3250628.1 valine--tRNA ligase [Candidatus Andersenbacteria bacterium]